MGLATSVDLSIASDEEFTIQSEGSWKALAFRAASYLTDPICKAHEFFRRICVVDALHPMASKIANFVRKVFLLVALVGCVLLATITTLPGIALRGIASSLQKEPFLYAKGEVAAKELPEDRSFTVLSWNVCCVSGGYSISDGGVEPWAFRVDQIVEKIVEKDADVNCLYETFDTESAFYLCEKLKEHGYAHFYFNIGPRAVGVSSGMFVASKYNIQNPEFSLFPRDTLVGRTKMAAKGIFGFDLESRGKIFVRVYATHLQHSEIPASPSGKERKARRKQMEILVEKVDQVKDRCVVVVGDLNLDDEEYEACLWRHRFQKGDLFEKKTWGGDAFCASLVRKPISGSLNLDHAMLLKGSARSIATSLVETGFDPKVFKRGVLSDHGGLFAKVVV